MTRYTGANPRLLVGPMNEFAESVGGVNLDNIIQFLYCNSVATNADATIVITCQEGGQVYVGTDPSGGQYSWTVQDVPLADWKGVTSNSDGSILYAFNDNNVYKGTDPSGGQ